MYIIIFLLYFISITCSTTGYEPVFSCCAPPLLTNPSLWTRPHSHSVSLGQTKPRDRQVESLSCTHHPAYQGQAFSACGRPFCAMASPVRTASPMAGPTGCGPTKHLQTPSKTRADNTKALIPLGPKDARWLPLVPTAPPSKERELPNAVWTVVARRGRRQACSIPSLAQTVEQGTSAALLRLSYSHKPPLASAVKQAATRTTTHRPPLYCKPTSTTSAQRCQARVKRAPKHHNATITPGVNHSKPTKSPEAQK